MAGWGVWPPVSLKSLSTLGVPSHGYGIRYEHGLFRQRIVDGRQVELPETWLQEPHAWEFERPETRYRIGFGGTTGRTRLGALGGGDGRGLRHARGGLEGRLGQYAEALVGAVSGGLRPRQFQPGRFRGRGKS